MSTSHSYKSARFPLGLQIINGIFFWKHRRQIKQYPPRGLTAVKKPFTVTGIRQYNSTNNSGAYLIFYFRNLLFQNGNSLTKLSSRLVHFSHASLYDTRRETTIVEPHACKRANNIFFSPY